MEEIRTFINLVEAQSATAAAERMGVAVSAVSRRMKELESRLGVQLITRTTRTMHLSEAGELYYRRCRQLIDDFEEAQFEVSQASRQLKGRLRVSAPLSFGVSHLAPAVVEFMHLHPELIIDVDLSDRRVDLVKEGYDLAVRVGALEDSSLRTRKISSVRHVVCAAPEFLSRHGVPEKPDDLNGLSGLCYSNLNRPERWEYQSSEGEQGFVRVAMKMSSNNGDLLREAAIKGLGVLCEPSFIIHSAVEKGELIPVLTDYQWYGMDIVAIYPQTRHLSVKVRTFIDFLVERFGDKPYWEAFLEK